VTAAATLAHADIATTDLTPPRLSEVVLRTSRYDEMKAWYQQVLGVKPYFEHTPAGWDTLREQLTEKLPTELRLCFMRIASGYPFGQVIALFDYPRLAPSETASGLHHMQLRHASVEELFTRFERLASVGIVPYKSFNHGPSTSFYYQDVDGNMAELSAANFPTEEGYHAFLKSPAYAANPVGIAVDPAVLARRWRAGESAWDIVQKTA
jgi:catechol 2,3-dioxygenase-like lactoylglutathione lyase family enzyme